MTTPDFIQRDSDRIYIDIVDRNHDAGWRIIGSCPERVSWSGGLHVYRGNPACVYDCATSEVVAVGRSLYDVLQKLAVHTGLVVELHDDERGFITRFPLTKAGDAR